MVFSKLRRDVRNINRLKDILTILAKYGFDYIIDHVDLPFPFIRPRKQHGIHELSIQARTKSVFEELGPTFIKLGQMLSVRPDIIPYTYCKEFEKLQDSVSPLPFEAM